METSLTPKKRSDLRRTAATRTILATHENVAGFLPDRVPPTKISYLPPLADFVTNTAQFLDRASQRLACGRVPYTQIFKCVLDRLDDYEIATTLVKLQEPPPAPSAAAPAAPAAPAAVTVVVETTSHRRCGTCRHIVRPHEFDESMNCCIQCIRQCRECHVSEQSVTEPFVNILAGTRSAVWVCQPCSVRLRGTEPCFRCHKLVQPPILIGNRSERPMKLCPDCVYTCPCCTNTEVASGNVHRPNLAPGRIPPNCNFCRTCFEMAERAVKHHSDKLHVVGIDTEALQRAIESVPANLARQRGSLTSLLQLHLQFPPAP